MRKIAILVTLICSVLVSNAQDRKISGTLVEQKTGDAMVQTTVQLLKSDSVFVTGSVTKDDGSFAVTAPSDGRYIVKITNIGFSPLFKNVRIANAANVDLGKLKMKEDAVMLKEATITGQAVKVVLKEDTFVYNASAFKTPEGSVLEELVKRLPGAQIDDDGNITINGKEVKKIMIDGKEFMTGDTKTAMKNIPTSIIEKVKAYDQKSDMARITGIDDGEEETVLDFGVKKGMNKGFMSNIDLAVGTKSRYSEKGMGAYMNSDLRVMALGSANNVNDRGFPGGGGGGMFGGGGNGLTATKMLGANLNYEKKDKLMIDASVRWDHSNNDTRSISSSENFVATAGSFSNSLNQSYSRSDKWDARMRLEWKPDSMTTIQFRPSFSYTSNDGRSTSSSASFNEDPYNYATDPLDATSIEQMALDGLVVNTRVNNSITYSNSKSASGNLILSRKLNSKGRNITLRLSGNYGSDKSKSLSTNNVHLYQILNSLGADSTYQTNRYSVTPNKSYGYSAQATYSEPIFKQVFLQFSYRFAYSYTESDRSTYDFSNLGEDFFSGVTPVYRNWSSYLSRLENPYEDYLDGSLSRYSEYKNYTHRLQLMLKIVKKDFNFNAGIMYQPQRSHFIQNYLGRNVDTVRTVYNFSPTLDFRYKISKVTNLRISYRGESSQPSISNMLDITDDSDPLNISKGNPGLKPSFTNNFRLSYNTYFERRQTALGTFINFRNVSNDIGNRVTYDETTGGRTTMPVNINGNWNVFGAFMFNTSIDTLGVWSISSFTNVRYQNMVGYVSLDSTSDSEKNITRSTSVGERLSATFRKDWIELSLDGSFDYSHAKNQLQSQNNLNTWKFAYGGSMTVYAPWGTSISTDIHENSRRGYNDNSMNTNELIWNAQIAQSFLKGKALTLTLQFYDLLNRQSNFSRAISATQRSDTQYNSINSYAMLHAIYRFNAFGGKQGRNGMREGDPRRPDRQRGDRDRGPRGGGFGPPPGGFGPRF